MANITINNLIFGRYWVDLAAGVTITNVTTGEVAKVSFKHCK